MNEPSVIPRADVDLGASARRVTDDAVRVLQKALATIGHLLSPAEHAELTAGLAEMTRWAQRNAIRDRREEES